MTIHYSKKVLEYFFHPKNFGKIKKPSGKGQYKSSICDDITTFYIQVKNNKISEISFTTLGCAVSIAAASVLSEMAKGKTLEEAPEITPQKIAEALGGLPESKMHCAILVHQALKAAIENSQKSK